MNKESIVKDLQLITQELETILQKLNGVLLLATKLVNLTNDEEDKTNNNPNCLTPYDKIRYHITSALCKCGVEHDDLEFMTNIIVRELKEAGFV